MKCIYCGADAIPVSDTSYDCPFCGGKFETEKKPVVTEDKPKTVHRELAPKVKDGAAVFEENINCVLEITWNVSSGDMKCGSGLLINDSGYALTNAHVVTYQEGVPAKELKVKIAGTTVKADVIRLGDKKGGRGDGVDLALIKLRSLPAAARFVTFADFEKVRIGEQVFVIGNSLGDGSCITAGIVSDKQRKVNGHTVLMTDCAINGGNSGGPIFNNRGEVIGVICSSRLQNDGSATEGMNYAIPVNIAADFLNGKHTAAVVDFTQGANVRYKMAANGPKCPKCGSTNTDVAGKANIGYCYDCEHEFQG